MLISKFKNALKANGSEFLIVAVAQGLYLLQGLLQNKIFSSFFETSVFGTWSLVMSAYSLVSMLPFTAVEQGIYKVAYRCREEGNEKVLNTLLIFFYFSFFGIYSVIFFSVDIISGSSFFMHGYTLWFALYAFTEILKNTFLVLDNSYRKRKKILWIRLFGIASRTALFFALYFLGHFSIENVLIVLFATNLIILLFEFHYFKTMTLRFDPRKAKAIAKQVLGFSAPLLLWAIFGWMQNMISRWYLDALLDLEAVAEYSVLTTLSYFVPNAVYVIVNAYVMPIVFQSDRRFTRKSLLKFIGLVGLCLSVYVLFVVFFGRWLVVLLADGKYVGITRYLWLTTISASLYVLSMLSTVEIYRRGKTKKLIVSTILPGVFMASCGFFLIKYYGFFGAVLNYIAGHVLYIVLTSFVVFNKRNLDVEERIDPPKESEE